MKRLIISLGVLVPLLLVAGQVQAAPVCSGLLTVPLFKHGNFRVSNTNIKVSNLAGVSITGNSNCVVAGVNDIVNVRGNNNQVTAGRSIVNIHGYNNLFVSKGDNIVSCDQHQGNTAIVTAHEISVHC